jgi:hypothetical protein
MTKQAFSMQKRKRSRANALLPDSDNGTVLPQFFMKKYD